MFAMKMINVPFKLAKQLITIYTSAKLIITRYKKYFAHILPKILFEKHLRAKKFKCYTHNNESESR